MALSCANSAVAECFRRCRFVAVTRKLSAEDRERLYFVILVFRWHHRGLEAIQVGLNPVNTFCFSALVAMSSSETILVRTVEAVKIFVEILEGSFVAMLVHNVRTPMVTFDNSFAVKSAYTAMIQRVTFDRFFAEMPVHNERTPRVTFDSSFEAMSLYIAKILTVTFDKFSVAMQVHCERIPMATFDNFFEVMPVHCGKAQIF